MRKQYVKAYEIEDKLEDEGLVDRMYSDFTGFMEANFPTPVYSVYYRWRRWVATGAVDFQAQTLPIIRNVVKRRFL